MRAVVKEAGEDTSGVSHLDVHDRDDGGADLGAIDKSVVGCDCRVVAVNLIPVFSGHTVWSFDTDEIVGSGAARTTELFIFCTKSRIVNITHRFEAFETCSGSKVL